MPKHGTWAHVAVSTIIDNCLSALFVGILVKRLVWLDTTDVHSDLPQIILIGTLGLNLPHLSRDR